MKISDRLTIVRKSMNKNQIPFAQELGVSQSAYATYERGVREVPISLAIQLCENYNISPAWLLLGRGEMHSPNYLKFAEKAVLETREHIIERGFDVPPEIEAKIVGILFENLIVNQAPNGNDIDQLLRFVS